MNNLWKFVDRDLFHPVQGIRYMSKISTTHYSVISHRIPRVPYIKTLSQHPWTTCESLPVEFWFTRIATKHSFPLPIEVSLWAADSTALSQKGLYLYSFKSRYHWNYSLFRNHMTESKEFFFAKCSTPLQVLFTFSAPQHMPRQLPSVCQDNIPLISIHASAYQHQQFALLQISVREL